MDELNKLFAAYRESLPDPEPGANFVPGIWKRIEARRPPVFFIRRMTQALVMLSAVVALLLGMVVIPKVQRMPVYRATYIDVLEAEQQPDSLAYAAVVQPIENDLPEYTDR